MACYCVRTTRCPRKVRGMLVAAKTSLLFLLIDCFLVLSHAFNCDTSSPITRWGPEGSYFGYSLTMHRELNENMLLVGAPRAQTNQPGIEAGGALYKCPFSSVPFTEDCHQVTLDAAGNDLRNGEEITNKSGQMLGATVQSGGPDSPVVVCRPLYTWFVDPVSSPITMRQPVGGCIIARHNFTEVTEYTPCRNNETEDLWACQLGLSAAVTPDEILFGAVGSFLAKGQIYVVDFFQGFNSFHSRKPINLENSDYKGYSVAFGDFDGDGYNEYIIGTPRGAQNRGLVSILDAALSQLNIFEGTQMGEYFGHTLVASDFNGDGIDDLVISAPMYSDRRDNVIHYDVGRVFIYHTNVEANFHPPQILMGQRSGARFGFSLAALGDINQDDYLDLAIGAPHDGDTGQGRVYIYHSSGRHGLSHSPAQILDPELFGMTWPTFGFSMAAGMDMDDNGYPDLVVGMYKASALVLLRSRPIIDISAQLSVDIPGIRLGEAKHRLENNILVFGFNVTLCLSHSGRNVPREISLDYNLTADTDLPVTQRCFFNLIEERNVMEIQYRVNLTLGSELCLSHEAYMANTIQDKLTPLSLRVEYKLIADERNSSTPSIDVPPMLNSKTSPSTSITVPILRNCQNITCVPDLSLAVTKNVETLYVEDSKNVVLVITVSNRGEDAYQSKLLVRSPTEFLFARSEQLSLGHDFISTCSNDVRLSLLTCNVGNPLRAGTELKIRMEFENLNLSGHVNLLTFHLEVRSVEAERRNRRRDNQVNINIPVHVMASMELVGMPSPTKVVIDLEEYPHDREVETEDDVGPEICHYYSLINKGPSNVGATTVTIEWPLFTRDNNVFLFLTRASMSNGRACSVNARVKQANFPLESKVAFQETYRRPDRLRCSNITSSSTSSSTPQHAECCSLQNCATITCSVDQLLATSSAKADVVISIKSRLWINNSHAGYYSNMRISSSAFAETTGSYYPLPFLTQPSANATVTTTVVLAVDERDFTRPIPLWIYLVAASIGLLIVILLIFILWKIGFFKRKKITPEQKKKLERSGTASAEIYDSHR